MEMILMWIGMMLKRFLPYKLETKVFILLQILDIALTFFALRLDLANELNPFGFTAGFILFKFFVIVGVSYVLERVDFGKLVYIILFIPFFVVIWNSINIIFSLSLYFR